MQNVQTLHNNAFGTLNVKRGKYLLILSKEYLLSARAFVINAPQSLEENL
jgi:hypothetical protein